MKRWSIFFLIFSIIALSLSCQTYAFGIATPYFPDDTVNLESGQSFLYTIKIQNNEALSFNINLSYSSDDDVAILNTTDFFIPEKSYENAFTFIITIPNISLPGTVYNLQYTARPITNNSGQVPMNVEIKRGARFLVVDENGQGYFIMPPNRMDIIMRDLLKIFNATYIYITGVLAALALIFVVLRLWKLSKSISAKAEAKAPYTISEAKSTHELRVLIRMMPKYLFDNEFIRREYSEKFKELNEQFLGNKVLTADRREMLRILR